MRSLMTLPLGGLSCLVPFGWKILFCKTQVIYNTEGYLGLEELQGDRLRVSSQCLYPSCRDNRFILPPR